MMVILPTSRDRFDLEILGLAAICGLLVIPVLIIFHRAFRQGLRQVPGPFTARFTGLWRVRMVWNGDTPGQYRELHSKYGSIVRTAPNVVDIADPTVVPIIYGINSKYIKSRFYDVFAPIYEDTTMHSLFTTQDPDYHKALKRPVAQKFSMSAIRTLEPLVDECSIIFTEAMADLAGQRIDLGAWLQWYAFDVVGAITFSQRFGFMEERRDVDKIIEGLEFGLRYGGTIGQMPFLHPYLLGSIYLTKLVKWLAPKAPNPVLTVIKMTDQAIKSYDERNMDETMKRDDFLAWLRQQESSIKSPISNRDMMNHLMNNLLAGSDTTAISLRSIFYYLIMDTRVYDNLQQEIDEAQKAGKLSDIVSYAESLELPYLQLVMKEAMRMHPGVQYPLERIVPEGGAQLCGKFLPAGTVVGVNAAVIHQDKGVFGEDADSFRPERWSQSQPGVDVAQMERTLLTFGAGARTCIGKNISLMEMGKVIPQILRQFHLEWASDQREWTVKTWWFARQTNMLVKLRPRRNLAGPVEMTMQL